MAADFVNRWRTVHRTTNVSIVTTEQTKPMRYVQVRRTISTNESGENVSFEILGNPCRAIQCNVHDGGGICIAEANGSPSFTCSECADGSNQMNTPCLGNQLEHSVPSCAIILTAHPCKHIQCDGNGGGGECKPKLAGTSEYICRACQFSEDQENEICPGTLREPTTELERILLLCSLSANPCLIVECATNDNQGECEPLANGSPDFVCKSCKYGPTQVNGICPRMGLLCMILAGSVWFRSR